MLNIEVLSPENVVYRGEADEVIAPTSNGQIAIFPHHVSLLTKISEGELIVKSGKQTQYIAVMDGFLQVRKDFITVLADYAIQSEDIQMHKAEEAKKRAEKLLEERVGQKDFAIIEADLRRSLLELKVAQKRRRVASIQHK